MRRHVGGAADLVLVARDEHVVHGRHQIGLDEVGTLIDRKVVSGERVLGPLAAGTAMRDHDHLFLGRGRHGRAPHGIDRQRKQHDIAEAPADHGDKDSGMQWTINGQVRTADPDLRTTLADLLRDHLELTGTKIGCNHGQCGACTVLVNGRR
jgi:hypothetical protein